MKRSGGPVAIVAFTGCIGLVVMGGAFGQSAGNGEPENQRRTPLSSSSSSGARSSDTRTPLPDPQRVPLPDPQRVPLPAGGGRTPIGSSSLPNVPPPRDRLRDTPRDRGVRPDAAPDANSPRLGDGDRRDRGMLPHRRSYRRPGYYDYWRDGRHPGYDDGYRGYDPQPPVDRNAPDPSEPPGARGDQLGALLPPDDLMDEDQPPALRRALDASPQYREATAQLLRAWADYARAAEQVLQRLRLQPVYRRALADLRQAEAKVAAVRDRGGNVPAVNLVSAAQEAMLARRAVRALEEKAINADPVARRAKQQVDQAIERRNKIRDDIAATLPAEDQS